VGRPTEAPPIPDWLRPFRDRAAAFAELDPEDLIQALLIRYDPGAGIGWHRDRPIYGHVIGISLGEPATLVSVASDPAVSTERRRPSRRARPTI
jgi:alkylated DNA repair protein (DNA oxidative demethylase)